MLYISFSLIFLHLYIYIINLIFSEYKYTCTFNAYILNSKYINFHQHPTKRPPDCFFIGLITPLTSFWCYQLCLRIFVCRKYLIDYHKAALNGSNKQPNSHWCITNIFSVYPKGPTSFA